MKLFSPAKINLFLNVLSKRADGYHELWTLFERLSLGDEIVLTPRKSGISLKCTSDPSGGPYRIPEGPTNLARRAAKLLLDELNVQKGVHIRLKKRIPVSAGLGGGSSNAATVLLGLNRLWKLRLPKNKLMRLGAKLGSDVPFFLLEASLATGAGRGEILKPVTRFRRKLWHVLVKPPFNISTKEAYARLGALTPPRLTPQKSDVRMLLRSLGTGDPEPLEGLLTNSLELVLNKRLRAVIDIKKKLVLQGACAALMSGSGSTVFGLFWSEKKARLAARNLRKMNKRWRVFVASTY